MARRPNTQTVTGRAFARVGLLGNPSDGYGGRVLATTVSSFEATVALTPADRWDFADLALLEATVEALSTRRPALVADPVTFGFTTTIPRQVGLSGSSAIIIAALRALADRAGHDWDRVELARTALEVETQVLGWAAGPQDRVVQSYEGLVDMDFAEPWRAAGYESLPASLLPPLFVAWNRAIGEPSDVAHSTVRDRWQAGDSQVVAAMHRFADLAVEGRAALDAGSAAHLWPSLLNEAFELRSSFWHITPFDQTLVETGQSRGAGVAFAGSGGAVVGAVPNSAVLTELAAAYDRLGAGFLVINE